jgi:hypothetical protein
VFFFAPARHDPRPKPWLASHHVPLGAAARPSTLIIKPEPQPYPRAVLYARPHCFEEFFGQIRRVNAYQKIIEAEVLAHGQKDHAAETMSADVVQLLAKPSDIQPAVPHPHYHRPVV